MTTAERTHLAGIHAECQRLKDYLNSAPLDPIKASTDDWHGFLVTLLKLQGNPARDLHFVGQLLARDYLMEAFKVPSFDVTQSPSSSKDWDIDVTTPDGQRIIGLVVNYRIGPHNLMEIVAEKADHRFAFFTNYEPFNHAVHEFQKHFPTVTFMLLPERLRMEVEE